MGLFSGFGRVLSGALGFLGARERNRAQERVNQDNIRLSWDMWHAANEYNSPQNQMARFKAAGLNPNLIYGQMSNVPPPAYVKAEAANSSGFDSIADAIKDYEGMQLQREGMEHQMKVADANVALAKERNDLQAKAFQSSEENFAKEFAERSRLRDLEAKKYEAEIAYTNARTNEIEHPKPSSFANLLTAVARAAGLEVEPETAEGVVEGVKTGAKVYNHVKQYRSNVKKAPRAYGIAGIK